MGTECWKGCFKDRPAGHGDGDVLPVTDRMTRHDGRVTNRVTRHDGRVTDRGYNAYGG